MSLLHNQQSTAAIRPIDPLSQNSFFYSIGDILARHWDPLDISDTHWPHSEYERYIPAVYNRALNNSDSEKLFNTSVRWLLMILASRTIWQMINVRPAL